METGKKRAVCVWHRRSGKDLTLFNFIITQAFIRKGIYYYLFPTYAQGKKILWEGMTKDGTKFLDFIPKELIRGKPNETEMKIEFTNGSHLQIIGTDNINSVVGTNPVGCVFSEYSLQSPVAWQFIRPILKENDGWAVFNFTPRGKNHGFDILEVAKKNNWFYQVLTVEDTGVITPEMIEEERREGMSEEMIQQEYYCSFDSALIGAYYSKYVKTAEDEKRIGFVPYEPMLPVSVVFDLGMNDEMVLGFFQTLGQEIRVIDVKHDHGQDLAFYAKLMQETGYRFDTVYLPFDAKVKEMTSGLTRDSRMRQLVTCNVVVLPQLAIKHGMDALRGLFPRIFFDASKCQTLVQALKEYRQEYDEERKIFKDTPLHDWSSHFADMMRYMAVAIRSSSGLYSTQSFSQRGSFAPQSTPLTGDRRGGIVR